MNNGRILQGARPPLSQQMGQQPGGVPTGMGGMQPMQNQQQGYAQVMAGLVAAANAKPAQGQSASVGFSYDRSNTTLTGTWGEMAQDLQTDKLIRDQAYLQASEIGFLVMRGIQMRNEKHGFYSSFLSGIKRICYPNIHDMMRVDPIGEQVFNEIQNNHAIYNRILSNTIVQVVGELTRLLVSGYELRKDGSDVREFVVDASSYCAVQTLVDWLYGHPERVVQMSMVTQPLRQLMQKAEEAHGFFQGRYDTVPNAEHPWGVGRVKELLQGKPVNNVLLDTLISAPAVHTPSDFFGNMGEIAVFGNNFEVDNNGVAVTPEFKAKMARENQEWMNNQMKQYQKQPDPVQEVQQWHDDTVSINSYDYQPIPSEKFQLNLRDQFNMADYFKEIPGTEYFIGSWKDTVNIGTQFYQEGRQIRIPVESFIGLHNNQVPVIRFIPNSNSLEVKLVTVTLTTWSVEEEMNKFLTDPASLLPFMYTENGEVKTSWEPKVQETSERLDNEGHFTPIDPMAPQNVEPHILVAKTPILSENDGETLARLDAAVKTFDPKGKLDAFIIPAKMVGTFTFSSVEDIDAVYKEIFMFERGVDIDHRTTADYFYSVSRAIARINNPEFAQLVTTHLSNLVNRWLVECRGYPEVRTQNGFIEVTDILNDADDLYELLKKKDPDTARAFQHLQANTFFMENLQIFAPKEEVITHFKKKAGDDPVDQVIAEKQADANLLWTRDVMVVSVNHISGPVSDSVVTIKESQEPKLFAIVKQAFKYGEKHFKGVPQILIRFESPEGLPVRIATFSDYDKSVMKLRALDRYQGLIRTMPVTHQ